MKYLDPRKNQSNLNLSQLQFLFFLPNFPWKFLAKACQCLIFRDSVAARIDMVFPAPNPTQRGKTRISKRTKPVLNYSSKPIFQIWVMQNPFLFFKTSFFLLTGSTVFAVLEAL